MQFYLEALICDFAMLVDAFTSDEMMDWYTLSADTSAFIKRRASWSNYNIKHLPTTTTFSREISIKYAFTRDIQVSEGSVHEVECAKLVYIEYALSFSPKQ